MGKAGSPRSGHTRNERSAGVILFRRDENAPGGKLFLLLDYGQHWDYPKGHVEKGEEDLTAALRELAEETGIRKVQIIAGFEHPIVYFFRHSKKGTVRKTVVFFLARTEEADVTLSDEHEGYKWLPEEGARKRLTYATAREVFEKAVEFLANSHA